jgi:hypothetical protein
MSETQPSNPTGSEAVSQFVSPAVVETPHQQAIHREDTFSLKVSRTIHAGI